MSFSVRAAGVDELTEVWQWEYGPVTEQTVAWLARIADWSHVGIWRETELVGVISWETWPEQQVCLAVSTKRRSCSRAVLRRVLIALGNQLFDAGVQTLCCIVPPNAPAVRRLARSCRLQAGPVVRGYQLFTLSVSDRFTEKIYE